MKKKGINLLLLIGLLCFAALSFTPCINEVHTYFLERDQVLHGDGFTEACSYLPPVVCFFTVIELLLCIFARNRAGRLVGLFLHLIKSIAPYKLYTGGWLLSFGGLTEVEYSLTAFGYNLLILAVLITGLYMMDFVRMWHGKDQKTDSKE